jgi:hypothetical protein
MLFCGVQQREIVVLWVAGAPRSLATTALMSSNRRASRSRSSTTSAPRLGTCSVVHDEPMALVRHRGGSSAFDRRVRRARRRAARSPGRPWASNARCQSSSSSSESAYRRHASSIVMAPLLRAARTAALRRATHLFVFDGGRSAIDRGCSVVQPYARNSPLQARTASQVRTRFRPPIGPRHVPPGEPQPAVVAFCRRYY